MSVLCERATATGPPKFSLHVLGDLFATREQNQ